MIQLEDRSDKSIAVSVIYSEHPMALDGCIVIDQISMKQSEWDRKCDAANVNPTIRANRVMVAVPVYAY